PSVPQVDSATLVQLLPNLLKAGSHSFPQADKPVDYRYMSDDFARANSAPDFLTFSAALRMLYTAFGAFDGSADGQKLLTALNRYTVTVKSGNTTVPKPMGTFFKDAAAKLIDYDPNSSSAAAPQLTMPHSWQILRNKDQSDL